jgi:hypothetical protein
MAYTLSKTNGQTLIFLNDGLVDTAASSINLIGKNVSNFGDAQNENFVHMLENFAYTAQPNKPLQGQLWFNSNTAVLRPLVYDGTNYRPLAVLLYSTGTTDTLINAGGTNFAATTPGDMWFNKGTSQLYVITGTNSETTLIGPEIVKGFDTTKMSSVKMTDTSNVNYPVIQITLGGEVIGIISSSTFVPSGTTAVAGFTKINRGITFKNYNSSTRYTTATTDVQLYGLHEQLDPTVVRSNVAQHVTASWNIDTGNSLIFGTATQSSLSWSSSATALVLATEGIVKLQSPTTALDFDGLKLVASDSTVDLGTSVTKFNALYVNAVSATTITTPTINATTVGATNVNSVNVIASTVNATTSVVATLLGDAVYDTGARVLTTATIGDYGVSFITGTDNQVTVSQAVGSVVLGLPDTVKIKRLQGGGAANTGTISGTWTLEAGSTMQATYADLAECYKADANYVSGTVLEFGGEFEVTVAEDSTRRVAGVVSTNPAYLMNRQLMGDNVVVVALTGRVPCKVRGKIQKGDMMVAAGNGYARAEFNPMLGSVIGKALEDFEGTDGVIEVVVGRL